MLWRPVLHSCVCLVEVSFQLAKVTIGCRNSAGGKKNLFCDSDYLDIYCDCKVPLKEDGFVKHHTYTWPSLKPTNLRPSEKYVLGIAENIECQSNFSSSVARGRE